MQNNPIIDCFDPIYDSKYMTKLFEPTSIAIVGVSERENSVGRAIILNLLNANSPQDISNANLNKKYALYPVNPKKKYCFGIKCYSNLNEIPYSIDLVIIATPAETVIGIVKECGEKQISVALIISSGFKEIGNLGINREKELLQIAKKFNIRVLGPNCLGFMNVDYGINAMFAGNLPKKGTTAFLSQSGALCTTILDWAKKVNMGFSKFVSVGSMSDISWVDLLEYISNDCNTKTIIMYIESIGDDSSDFVSTIKEVAAKKLIIILKAGKSKAGHNAAISHTGSIVGNYDSLLSIMKSVGVLMVDTIDELLNYASFLDKMTIPKGPRLMIITNAGGPGVLAVDSLIENGGQIATLNQLDIEKLNKFLPKGWSHCNPIDILGDANEEIYLETIKIFENNLSDFDGLLIIFSPQDIADPLQVAKVSIPSILKIKNNIPVICVWMGAYEIEKAKDLFNKNGIYVISSPDTASKIFSILYKHFNFKNNNQELKKVCLEDFCKDSKEHAIKILENAIENGYQILDEQNSKKILELYKIPTSKSIRCISEDEVINACKNINFPVVCKLISNFYSHKSDVGGVILNIKNEFEAVNAFKVIRENLLRIDSNAIKNGSFIGVTIESMFFQKSIELILGSISDFQFGPLIMFGSGGIFVEIFKDTVISLPIFDKDSAKQVISKTKIYSCFDKISERFPKVNIEKLSLILIRFSNMISDLSQYVFDCDINPLMAFDTRDDSVNDFIAVDVRFTLRKTILPIKNTIVRPYPYEYIGEYELFFEEPHSTKFCSFSKEIKKINIRPLQAIDISSLIKFLQLLLKKKFEFLKESINENKILNKINSIFCSNYNKRIYLISEICEVIVGISRIEFTNKNRDYAVLYVIVASDLEGSNLSKILIEKNIYIARKEGINLIRTSIEEKFNILMNDLGFIKKEESGKFYYELSLN